MKKKKANQLFLDIQMSGMGNREHPGNYPTNQDVLFKQKGGGPRAWLTGTPCWLWSQTAEVQGCHLISVQDEIRPGDYRPKASHSGSFL